MDPAEGYKLVAIFVSLMAIAQLCRNRQIHSGLVLSFKIRKVLISFLFDKVIKLSVKSMTETNSGKLISLISADLFHVEKGIGQFAILATTPFVNAWAFYLLFKTISWQPTLIVFGF